MRTSGLPNFKKLWGIIHTDLTPGTYSININLLYDSTEWQGDRTFLLTTLSNVGGKNFWLPSTFFVVGLLGMVAAGLFWRRMSEFRKIGRE
jgi:hypothetical protein